MNKFQSDGVGIAYKVEGEGAPIVLVHGFASTHIANWVAPGWVAQLRDMGRQVVMFDLRGHGQSALLYDPDAYRLSQLAQDLKNLIAHLGLEKPDVMGYSLGAMIALRLGVDAPDVPGSIIAAGIGEKLYQPPEHITPVVDALLTDDPSSTTDMAAKAFRIFADQNNQDRRALATCFQRAREPFTPDVLSRITCPVLVVAGEKDVLAGDPYALAASIPSGEAALIPRRDHMRAVGDKAFFEIVRNYYS
ncbi:MAG: alpha/beta hydrolase [Parvibaculaceae bacterium]|nr:alpha/beta hydrolase [Parvibaculaceae bacterium]